MKIKIKVEKEVEIKHVLIDIAPRYIGDDEDDDIPSNFPLLNESKTAWVAKVNIDTGQIEGWPQGEIRKLFCKVCDAGVYKLLDENGNVVATHSGYVPHGIVPGEYGDYVELDINESGIITNWPKELSFCHFLNEDE